MKLFDQRHQTYVHAFQPADAVKLVQSGQEYFDVLVDLIRKAKRSIHLHTYIFANDDIGKTISDELISAAERGVDVSVVMDGYGSLGFSPKLFQEWKTKRIQAHFFRGSLFSKISIWEGGSIIKSVLLMISVP
ncbi:MAG: hypothetical protein IPM34_02590 [Saprospiraceae bacterium]|nr:hypothetical protein [Saprospiraceae bacterium]